jgi:hypothetical protein
MSSRWASLTLSETRGPQKRRRVPCMSVRGSAPLWVPGCWIWKATGLWSRKQGCPDGALAPPLKADTSPELVDIIRERESLTSIPGQIHGWRRRDLARDRNIDLANQPASLVFHRRCQTKRTEMTSCVPSRFYPDISWPAPPPWAMFHD